VNDGAAGGEGTEERAGGLFLDEASEGGWKTVVRRHCGAAIPQGLGDGGGKDGDRAQCLYVRSSVGRGGI
jgi:hypothetical protein